MISNQFDFDFDFSLSRDYGNKSATKGNQLNRSGLFISNFKIHFKYNNYMTQAAS